MTDLRYAKVCCAVCGRAVERQRSTRVYCATACRMRAYRLRRDGPPRRRLPMPVRAHQAREPVQAEAPGIATATVRPVTLTEARAIIEKHEFLGTMPAVARWAFGIFFGERCGGAVVFGDEYCENLGIPSARRPRVPKGRLAWRSDMTRPW